jgi:aspartate/methionine/tyrosine aminotransferase
MKNEILIKSATRLDSVKEYYFSSKLREIGEMRAKGIDVLNLGIGSPDLSPAPDVVDVLNKYSQDDSMHAYQSYTGIPELRNAFAGWYLKYFNVQLNPEKEILPMIGSKEGIMHIAMTFLEPGDIALVPNPGYPTYSAASKLAGADTIEYHLSEQNNWLIDFQELESIDLDRVKIMWLNYPHMPTGVRANRELFEKLVVFAQKHGILLVNDNPYSFILNNEHLSILSVPGATQLALELNSLSKSHNMAGWRIGMLAGNTDLLKEVLRFKSNMDSGMFKPVQLAAAQALQARQQWFDSLNQTYRARRELVYDIFRHLLCTWKEDSVGLFVWAKVPETWKDGYQLSDSLLHEAHVFITPGGIFGSEGNNYLRASLCNTESVLQEAFNRVKSQLK